MNDPAPGGGAKGGALAVWLKLFALLAGLSVFGLLTFWLAKVVRGG